MTNRKVYTCVSNYMKNHTTEKEMNRRAPQLGTFEVCVPTHFALRLLSGITLASKAKKNTRGHVEWLRCLSVDFLFCDKTIV